jgi:hypothetical protein
MINVDESSFYFATGHEEISLGPDQEPPERPSQTIQESEIMVTIAWNPLRFHSVEVLPEGRSFNAE